VNTRMLNLGYFSTVSSVYSKLNYKNRFGTTGVGEIKRVS